MGDKSDGSDESNNASERSAKAFNEFIKFLKSRQEEQKEEIKSQTLTKPKKYRVVLISSDPNITFQAILEILENIFHQGPSQAEDTAEDMVYHKAAVIAGTYFYDVAETKALYAQQTAADQDYFLGYALEPIENF